jgi:hypothetical protein
MADASRRRERKRRGGAGEAAISRGASSSTTPSVSRRIDRLDDEIEAARSVRKIEDRSARSARF